MSESLAERLRETLRGAREAAEGYRAKFPGKVLVFRWEPTYFSVHGEDVALFVALFGPGLTPEPWGDDLLFREEDPDAMFRRIDECGLSSIIVDKTPCAACGEVGTVARGGAS